MKCYIALALLALVAVALAAEQPADFERLEPLANPELQDAPRDKRTVVLSSYVPYTYSLHGVPYAYRTPYYNSYYLH